MKKYTDKAFLPNASDLNHQMYKDGCDHFNKGDFSKAKNAFKEAIEYWPKDSQAWMALGNCFDELKKPKQAEDSFRKALKCCKEKDIEKYTYNLGNSLYDQEKLKEAIECYSSIKPGTDLYISAQKNLKLCEKELGGE